MGSVVLLYKGWRIIRLKTRKRAPTRWWRSCNCNTGPAAVAGLKEEQGASDEQVNKQEAVQRGTLNPDNCPTASFMSVFYLLGLSYIIIFLTTFVGKYVLHK